MKRTQQSSVDALLRAVEAAKTESQYNIFKDLKMLLEAYPKRASGIT